MSEDSGKVGEAPPQGLGMVSAGEGLPPAMGEPPGGPAGSLAARLVAAGWYRKLREGVGSQKEVAGALGVHWRTIQRRERGEIPVTVEAALALAVLFDWRTGGRRAEEVGLGPLGWRLEAFLKGRWAADERQGATDVAGRLAVAEWEARQRRRRGGV